MARGHFRAGLSQKNIRPSVVVLGEKHPFPGRLVNTEMVVLIVNCDQRCVFSSEIAYGKTEHRNFQGDAKTPLDLKVVPFVGQTINRPIIHSAEPFLLAQQNRSLCRVVNQSQVIGKVLKNGRQFSVSVF